MTVPRQSRAGTYRFLAEALLYPDDRDSAQLEAHARQAGAACPPWWDALQALLASPELRACDTYLESFEIGARAPLYLGHYLFAEPDNCRGAAICGRNDYMIHLKNLYRHFGLEMDDRELPDFLPLVLEFLALTVEHPEQERRAWMIKHYILPALHGLGKKLTELENVYSPAAEILRDLIHEELADPSATQAQAVTTAAQPEGPT